MLFFENKYNTTHIKPIKLNEKSTGTLAVVCVSALVDVSVVILKKSTNGVS